MAVSRVPTDNRESQMGKQNKVQDVRSDRSKPFSKFKKFSRNVSITISKIKKCFSAVGKSK